MTGFRVTGQVSRECPAQRVPFSAESLVTSFATQNPVENKPESEQVTADDMVDGRIPECPVTAQTALE